MLDDVKLALNGKCPAGCYSRLGGMVPTAREIYEQIMAIKGGF